jgi:signal transduction histidine kinase
VPLRSASGEVQLLVGIISDITRLKLAEEALVQANEQLEQRVAERTAELRSAQDALLRRERLAMLGQLAGGLAHQLRNPLGTIANAVSLCEKSMLAPPQRMALDVIREEVRRADRTIADLLDYARIRPPERRTVELAELVDGALTQERIGEGIEVSVEMAGAPAAFVDPVQVETAIGNVIRNALEAMPSGGKLQVRGAEEGGLALLVIRDTGPGVPATQVPSLFDPLVTTKPQGVGLGLSTARNLIENQGGSLRYTAAAGSAGAEFTVVMPAREER